MAKKSTLDSKLGSWTDQASLTQVETTPTPDASDRKEYRISRGLVQRIYEAADTSNQAPNEVVGQLLTWALDQVDAGNHQLKKRDTD